LPTARTGFEPAKGEPWQLADLPGSERRPSVPKRSVTDEGASADFNKQGSWMLSAKIDGHWQHGYYSTRSQTLNAFESLYHDYGNRLEDLKITDPHGIFNTRGVADALRICSRRRVH
jgi:hypothetical protein